MAHLATLSIAFKQIDRVQILVLCCTFLSSEGMTMSCSKPSLELNLQGILVDQAIRAEFKHPPRITSSYR